MKLFKKLRSRSGASLLIAIIFMLVCTFVGGSVLAAASANTRHLKTMLSDQQDLLTQRSAVNFLKSELSTAGQNVKLIITEKKEVTYPVIMVDGGGYERAPAPSKEERDVTIEISGTPSNSMETILLESAIARIQSVAPYIFELEKPIVLKDYSPTLNLSAENKASIGVTIAGSSVNESFTAFAECTGSADREHKKKMIEAFTVSFGDDTQTTLTMKANVSFEANPDYSEVPHGNVFIDKDEDIYTVTWRTPSVAKGGAAA